MLCLIACLGASEVPYHIEIGGVSWKTGKIRAERMPGIHDCPKFSYDIERSLRENRIKLHFNDSMIGEEFKFIQKHCEMLLSERQIDQWRSLLTKDAFYRFFVNGIERRVPASNGSLIYSTFEIRIDRETPAGQHRFEVIPLDPVDIVHEQDPMKKDVFPWTSTFKLSIGKVENDYPITYKEQETSREYVVLSWCLFIPTVILFLVSRRKFISANFLHDISTLPWFIHNVLFFAMCGFVELLRFTISAFIMDSNASFSKFANIGVFLYAIAAIVRSWIGKITNTMIIEADYIGFVLLDLIFIGIAPTSFMVINTVLFRPFRGYGAMNSICNNFGILTASYFVAKGASAASAVLFRDVNTYFKRPEALRTKAGPLGVILYGVGGAAIVSWAIPLIFDWLYGDCKLDLQFIACIVIALAAYASFFGLMRTINRLKSGKNHWHDDHLYYQLVIIVILGIEILWYIFGVKKVHILDFLSILSGGYCALSVIGITYSVACCGSYLTSFVFVYVTLIKERMRELGSTV